MRKETNPQTTFERMPALFMLFVSAISLLAITGWLFNYPVLASLRPKFIPMAPSTALIFLGLSGAWLILRVYSSRRGIRILVQAILVGMLIIVLFLALTYFTGFGFDLEQMLVPNPTWFGQIETARLSPLTALGFFLAIPAFLLITGERQSKRTKSSSAALSVAVLFFSGFVILGYLYGVPLFYGGTLIPMALTSAVSFMFLSLGLLMTAGPAFWPVRLFVGSSLKARLIRAFIPASLAIVLFQGLLSTNSASWIVNPALKVAVAAIVAWLIFGLIIFLVAQKLSTEIERGDQARKIAESSLVHSEAHFRSLVETASDAIINIDHDGQVIFWNRSAETIFGYSAEEMIGRPLGLIMPEAFRAAYQQVLQRILLTGESHIIGKTVEITGLRKDGSEFPLALSLATWRVDEDVFFTGIIRDISERKRSEEELQLRNTILTTQQEATIDGILVVDEDDHIILYNHRFTEMWGVPLDLLEQKEDDLLLEFNANNIVDQQSFLQRVKYLYEHKLETSQDEITLKNHKIFDRYSAPMIGPDGRYLGRVWYFRDVTESKQAEVALRASEERFRSLYENVPIGIYRTSPDGHILLANPALLRMLGYETLEELSEIDLATEGYVSEDRRQEFKNRVARDGEVRGFESAWKRKDGSVIYIRESARLVQNENNHPQYYEGTVEDISERKSAEQALRKSMSSLQAVLQSTDDGILAIGIENDVLYFNHRFAELWQIPQGLMTNKADSLLLQHVIDQLSDPQSFLKKIQDLYRSTEDSFDILNFKDGRVFERISHPMMEGEVALGRVWSFRDITERIRMEEEIRSLSLIDELTGLYNRRGFTLLAEQEVKLAHREKRSLLLIYGDVDNLKIINDTLGHNHGDQVLIEISVILKESLRESDILGRIGGDEFVALALDVSEEKSEIITNRIQSALEVRNQLEGGFNQFSLSVGIASFDPESPCTINELIANADRLMYQQKQARKTGRDSGAATR